MATFTTIEINGDHAVLIDDENFGRALLDTVRNPSNKKMLEFFGFDRAVRVLQKSGNASLTHEQMLVLFAQSMRHSKLMDKDVIDISIKHGYWMEFLCVLLRDYHKLHLFYKDVAKLTLDHDNAVVVVGTGEGMPTTTEDSAVVYPSRLEVALEKVNPNWIGDVQ